MNERDLFLSALAFGDPAERHAHLQSMCDGDRDLLDRVVALFASHDSQSIFLESPALVQLGNGDGSEMAATVDNGNGSAHREAVDDGDIHFDRSAAGSLDDDGDDEIPLGYLQPSYKLGSIGSLGHYEILSVVGRGAFGTVLRAFDEKLQRVVAIKVMLPELAAKSPARKRFVREAQASAAIRHENVVSVYAVEEKPIPYLVMEFIPGLTLQERLDERGPLDLATVLRLGTQIAEGLAAAHAKELIHRDIKPGNILLESSVRERVKITDFGLARAADDASTTQSGTIAGTPMYMAPEQALGKKLDQRADLFSFGSVLYQMISGRPPFRANSTLAVLKRLTDDTPRPIREIIPEAPQWLCDIIAKLHAKNPDDRFQSAREIADVLANCSAQLQAHPGLQVLSGIPPRKSASSARWKWIAAFAVLIPVAALLLTETAGMTQIFHRHPDGMGKLGAASTDQSMVGAYSSGAAQHRFASDEWIDVIPLIDPPKDRWNNPATGKNQWRINNGELSVGYADAKPNKLLLPLDSNWPAFECELEFTRLAGNGGFNLVVPAQAGDFPLGFNYSGNGRIFLGGSLALKKNGVSLAENHPLETEKRTTVRVVVRRRDDADEIDVWFDGDDVGSWTGNRNELANASREGYPHERRVSLWIHGGGNEFVFHRIRLRMLDGGNAQSLRPIPDATR